MYVYIHFFLLDFTLSITFKLNSKTKKINHVLLKTYIYVSYDSTNKFQAISSERKHNDIRPIKQQPFTLRNVEKSYILNIRILLFYLLKKITLLSAIKTQDNRKNLSTKRRK